MISTDFKRGNTGRRNQRGLATLFVSVILLFLATILALMVARATMMEQRMGANEVRYKQAFEAAQAGLDEAITQLFTLPVGVNKDLNNPNVVFPPAPTDTFGNGAQFHVSFCEPDSEPTCPDAPGAPLCTEVQQENFGTPLVASCGWSDDQIARKLVTQGVGTVTILGSAPTNPLIARGAVNAGGSANVVNYFNNLTIWTGGGFLSIGNAGKTFIRNPDAPPPPVGTVPPGEPNSCTTSVSYVCVTDKNTTGPDVISNDPTLFNLDQDQLFLNFFGRSFDDFAATSTVVAAADAGDLVGSLEQAFVITGDAVFPNATIGSRERPVAVVVDGNVSFQGTPTIHGIVYVRGDVAGGGNVKILGAAVVEGDVAPTGSVDIIYDPFTLGQLQNQGIPGFIPGSWRDW